MTKQRNWIISAGASLGFTFMIVSTASIARMVWATHLDGNLVELWKVYREFLFGTFLSPAVFFIYIPAFILSMYAVNRWGIEGRRKA